MSRAFIEDICILNSMIHEQSQLVNLFHDGFFNNNELWQKYKLEKKISGLINSIGSPLKKRMSQLSLGIYHVLNNGGAANITNEDEIYLFTAFAEIDTTNTIIKNITINNDKLVSPTLFHNSVHNTPLSYFTIINKLHNYCTTISDGLATNLSFIKYIKNRVKIDKHFIIASGDEYSDFYKLDKTVGKEIFPAYCSFKISPFSKKGFSFIGIFDTLSQFFAMENYNEATTLFTDKNTFFELKNNGSKNVYTEYPLDYDSPCGIVFRLALPFALGIKGKSFVIEMVDCKYYIFEVDL